MDFSFDDTSAHSGFGLQNMPARPDKVAVLSILVGGCGLSKICSTSPSFSLLIFKSVKVPWSQLKERVLQVSSLLSKGTTFVSAIKRVPSLFIRSVDRSKNTLDILLVPI